MLHEDDEGAATAEFAVVLPVVVIMAALLLYMARASVVQLECQDAAANVARALVVQENGSSTDGVASAVAGEGVQVSVTSSAERFYVTTTCHVIADPLHILPGTVQGKAIGVKQDE